MLPKHTGGLQPILNLKCFNRYMHIPSFKMPTLKHARQLIQPGDYAFSIDLPDAYLHIPIVKHHHCPSPNLFCSFAITRVCILLSIWMTSWSSFALNGQVRGHTCFCVPCWFVLVYISIFPSLTFTSIRPSVSWGYVGILSTCQYLCLLIS